MFVSVIFDNEYMGSKERIKWFQKSIYHARENDLLIVTHEYLKVHYEELVADCTERMYEGFEMKYVSKKELERIHVCFIPDSFFEGVYKKSGSRTRMLLELSNNRNIELENYIVEAIEKENKKVEGFFNALHSFRSIEYLAEKYRCPIIPYVFSSIRKVHGYQQTLYMANMSGSILNNGEIIQMYEKFDFKDIKHLLFNRKEIIALLGKERTLPLIPILDRSGVYEIGIAKEAFQIVPQVYQDDLVTDDDLFYESNRLFEKNQIVTRFHPMQYEQVRNRKHMKNDPISFILSCKRIATVQSQAILKAAIWNRATCVLGDVLPYSFLFSKDFKETNAMNENDLNFLLFCYLIPNKCMFDEAYWRWRKEKPSSNDIFLRHISEIVNDLGYSKDIIYDKENRLHRILEKRCNKYLVEKIVHNQVPKEISYKNILSRLQILYNDGAMQNLYCLNKVEDDKIVSSFEFDINKTIEKCLFYPLDDVDGFVEIQYIIDNVKKQQLVNNYGEKYCPKGISDFDINISDYTEKVDLEIIWIEKEKVWD